MASKNEGEWLKDGDRNSHYFHKVSKVRESRGNLRCLNADGEVLTAPNAIKIAVFNHFQAFFRGGRKVKAKLRCGNMGRISSVAKIRLEEPFTEAEIWATVQACDGNRAPGPDGFNLSFFKEFWGVIKDDILKIFKEFHEN